ncbi:hypothetical protein Salat_1836100 [Sesamum alatum]|uniref:Uncharacterized protein n=1 Tax=Sesamum alatum TaxID=300844 RepID=A0AAE1Y3G0_9LAMI|nr:hypothetical protein Salat_1836100 [Sesamum alatum]
MLAYIDFKISEAEYGRTRALHERLLNHTNRLKVWTSYAKLTASSALDEGLSESDLRESDDEEKRKCLQGARGRAIMASRSARLAMMFRQRQEAANVPAGSSSRGSEPVRQPQGLAAAPRAATARPSVPSQPTGPLEIEESVEVTRSTADRWEEFLEEMRDLWQEDEGTRVEEEVVLRPKWTVREDSFFRSSVTGGVWFQLYKGMILKRDQMELSLSSILRVEKHATRHILHLAQMIHDLALQAANFRHRAMVAEDLFRKSERKARDFQERYDVAHAELLSLREKLAADAAEYKKNVGDMRQEMEDLKKRVTKATDEMERHRQELDAAYESGYEAGHKGFCGTDEYRELVSQNRYQGAKDFMKTSIFESIVDEKAYEELEILWNKCLSQLRKLGGLKEGFDLGQLDITKDENLNEYPNDGEFRFSPDDEFFTLLPVPAARKEVPIPAKAPLDDTVMTAEALVGAGRFATEVLDEIPITGKDEIDEAVPSVRETENQVEEKGANIILEFDKGSKSGYNSPPAESSGADQDNGHEGVRGSGAESRAPQHSGPHAGFMFPDGEAPNRGELVGAGSPSKMACSSSAAGNIILVCDSDDETNHDGTACTPDRGANMAENEMTFEKFVQTPSCSQTMARRLEEKSGAVCDSQTPLQKFNALNDGDTTDSEDESCSDSYMNELIESLEREKLSRKWMFEADMLQAFQEDVELCMNAVCALYRQQIFAGKSAHGSSKHGVFSHIDSISGRELAEYLIDGDPELRLKKSVSDVKEQHPDVLSKCRKLATIYHEKLFEIYCNREDPFFVQT